jgi:hypothetical protein
LRVGIETGKIGAEDDVAGSLRDDGRGAVE